MNRETEVRQLAANVFLASEITEELLRTGEYIIFDDFLDVCGEGVAGLSRARRVFGLVAFAIADDAYNWDLYRLLDFSTNSARKEERREQYGRLLLSAQAVKDLHDTTQEERKYIPGMGPVARKVIERVIYDGNQDEYLSELGEYLNRDQQADL